MRLKTEPSLEVRKRRKSLDAKTHLSSRSNESDNDPGRGKYDFYKEFARSTRSLCRSG